MCPWKFAQKFAPMPARYAWVRGLSTVSMHRAQSDEISTSSDYKNCSAVSKKPKQFCCY